MKTKKTYVIVTVIVLFYVFMLMPKGYKVVVHYRRADNGHYTTKQYAETHPKTTVKETDKLKK